jgi:hypothetical protein
MRYLHHQPVVHLICFFLECRLLSNEYQTGLCEVITQTHKLLQIVISHKICEENRDA